MAHAFRWPVMHRAALVAELVALLRGVVALLRGVVALQVAGSSDPTLCPAADHLRPLRLVLPRQMQNRKTAKLLKALLTTRPPTRAHHRVHRLHPHSKQSLIYRRPSNASACWTALKTTQSNSPSANAF